MFMISVGSVACAPGPDGNEPQCNPSCAANEACEFVGGTKATTCVERGIGTTSCSVRNPCPEGQQCTEGKCVSGGSSGTLSCKGIWDCGDPCNGDNDCYDACYEKGSAEAKPQLKRNAGDAKAQGKLI